MKTTEITDANVTELFDKISALIEEARQRVLDQMKKQVGIFEHPHLRDTI